ncbi:MAG: sigma-70 family RNA polymerase sigma factor [Candidatus Gracilibacteria bacterium]|jgi:RNA polymerase sigma-70 factor (ECF subfamily)
MNRDEKPQLLQDLNQSTGVLLITDTNGHILYVNRQVEETKGFSEQEILGKRPGELWGGHMDESFYEKMWNYIYVQNRPFVSEVQNLNKQGDVLHEEVHIAPLLNPEGEVEYFIEIDPKVHTKSELSSFDQEFLSLGKAPPLTPDDLMHMLKRWILKEPLNRQPDLKEDFAHFMHRLFLSQNTNSKIEDKFLVESAQENIIAFKKLYSKYYKKIFAYFVHRVNFRGEAEELSQETFLRAFKSLNYFSYQDCTYLSYLLMIAHNLLVNHYRKYRPVLKDDLSLLATTDASEIYKDIELELLWKAVHELSKIEEQVLKMKYQEDRSVREIAYTFDKSENAIKLILSRARKKLGKQFAE